MANKYSSYRVRVILKDDTTLEILKDGVDNSKHGEVRKLYSEVKEAYKEKAKRVEFLGFQDGQATLIWDKVYIVDFKEGSLLDRFNSIVNEVVQEKVNLNERLSILDKEVDGIVHDIENIKHIKDIYSEEDIKEYKLQLVDNIIDSRDVRRDVKKELTSLSAIKLPDLKGANKTIKTMESFDMSKMKDNISVHTVTYTNIRDRDYLLKNLNQKYGKVVDMKNGTIKYCNTVYKKPMVKASVQPIVVAPVDNRIYRINDRMPQIKGITVKVKYTSMVQKIHIIKNMTSKFKEHKIDETNHIIELVERLA